jgi:hypothetical protein
MATIEQRRAGLLGQLAELDEQNEGYLRRRQLLEELVYVEQGTPTASTTAPARTPRRTIKGTELRRVAGRLLWRTQGEVEIHYREWFERVVAEGYAVGGKDPVASFLTNIRDSPSVKRGTVPGHYRLDPASVDRIRQELDEANAELLDLERSLERAYADTVERSRIGSLREHRDDLKQRVKRLDTKLHEVSYIFGEDGHDAETKLSTALRAA